MSTVIYLANRQIQILEGSAGKTSPLVKRFYTAEAPEGSLINGMVMDTESFIPFLQETWKSQKFPDKDVVLVAESTKFMGRTMELPEMGDRKTIDYIDREFSDLGREEDEHNLYSFIKLGKGEGKNIRLYTEAADPEFVNDYIEIFAQAGIKLSAIYSGKSALINFVAKEVSKGYKTFVIIVADIMTFSTVLWVNGTFSYYNSNRCFQVPGTEMYAMDLANSLSQLKQFMKANRIEYGLEAIEIAGVSPNDRDMYAQAIADQGIETPVRVYSLVKGFVSDPAVQNYLHPVSGLYGGGKMENLLASYNALKKRSKRGALPELKSLIILGALFLVMLIVVIALLFVRLGKKAELSALESYNQSPEVMFSVAEYDSVSERNRFLNSQIDAVKDVEENLYTYPLGDEQVLKTIDKCALGYAEVSYEAFDAQAGTIRFSALAKDVDQINKFIKMLMQEKIFSDVDYTGYVWNDTEQMWNIHVTCILAESAGR